MNSDMIEQGFQRVWQMFQETDRQFKETDRKFKETDRQFKETDRKIEETGRILKEIMKENLKESDKYFRKVRELDRNWGKLVEALIRPSVSEQFQKRGISVGGSGQREERKRGAQTVEIDILLTDADSLVAVEVKTTLGVQDVDEHIENHLNPFKKFFPEYKDKKVYGAVAYIHVEENADRYAYKNGLFVLTFSGKDTVKIKNDRKFVPKEW